MTDERKGIKLVKEIIRRFADGYYPAQSKMHLGEIVMYELAMMEDSVFDEILADKPVINANKPSRCTHCGKRRVIEFVCMFGMEEAEKPRSKNIELCKECTISKNMCRHPVCLDNYDERDDPL